MDMRSPTELPLQEGPIGRPTFFYSEASMSVVLGAYILGEDFSRKKKLHKLLPLNGDDKMFFNLLIGLKRTHIKLNNSKEKREGKVRGTGENVFVRMDTGETAVLRANVTTLESYIDDLTRITFRGEINRAWNMRLAINDLFTQGTETRKNTAKLKDWAENWKPKILGTQPSPASF